MLSPCPVRGERVITVKTKTKTKTKTTKAKRPVVRGPQKALPFEGRTPRLRYLEAPAKTTGNPFYALRVPKDVIAAFKAAAEKRGATANALVRAYMAKVGGVSLDDAGEE